jgi:phage head maturation protease
LFKEDEHGVWMRAEVSGTIWGREGYEAIDSGIVAEMSFGFRVSREGQEWIEEENEDGSILDIRKIKKFSDLPDFSPVSEPAYPTTEVYARSKELICRDKPESESSEDGPSPEDEVKVTPTEVLRQKLDLIEKEMNL